MSRWTMPALLLTAVIAGCSSTQTGPAPITTSDLEARQLYETGSTQFDRFHHDEAAESFRAATARDPDFAMAWLRLAFVTGTAEGYEECMGRAKAAAVEVTEAERQMIEAADAEHRGRLEEAREIRIELVRRYPEDARLRFELGLSYLSTDPGQATAHLEKAVELNPRLDVAWNMLGYVYSTNYRPNAAVRAHQRYVDLLPDEPNARDSLAETLMKAGRFKESIEEYQRALELDPSFLRSRLGIGHNLVLLGRFDDAKKAYQLAFRSAETPRDRYQAVDWLVVLGVYAGDSASALSASEIALSLAAELGAVEAAWAGHNTARILLLAGRPEDAERAGRDALAGLPKEASESSRQDLAQAMLRLEAEARLARGDVAGARTAVEEVRKRVETSRNAWQQQLLAFTEGYLALKKGDALSAEEVLLKASQTDPRVLFHLAEARAAMGGEAEAKALYRRVTEWNAPSLSHALVLERAKQRLAE